MVKLLSIIAIGMFGAIQLSLLNLFSYKNDHDSYYNDGK